jgi:hypothetical protein
MAFLESDVELERWRAVGLVIATLAKQATEASPAPPAEPAVAPRATKPASVALAKPAPAASVGTAPWMIDLSAEAARASQGVFGAYGGSLRLSRRISPRFVFLTSSVRYDLSPFKDRVAFRWLWLSAGAGVTVPLGSPRAQLEVRLEPQLGAVTARLDQQSGGGAASGTLWGLREGVGVGWWLSSWFGLCLSADAYQSNRATVARAAESATLEARETRIQALGWSGSIGLRFGLGSR